MSFRPVPPLAPAALHEAWQGRLWTVRPVYVVESSAEELVLWMQPGTRYLCPVGPDGGEVSCFLPESWHLRERTWHGGGCFYFVGHGAHHVLMAFLDEQGAVSSWYLNLQLPVVQRGRLLSYLDQELDIVLPPDLGSWAWKDEDRFADAIDRGVIDAEVGRWLPGYGAGIADGLVGDHDGLLERVAHLEVPDLPPLDVGSVLAAS